MNTDTLSRTGILIAYFDYETEEYSVAKDSEIQINSSFEVFFDNIGLKKEFELAKNKKQDIRNKTVKYDGKYFSIDTFEEDDKMKMKIKIVDISGVYQSRINATKDILKMTISLFRKNPILTGIVFTTISGAVSVGIWYVKDNIAQVQKDNFRLSQKLKETNVQFWKANILIQKANEVIVERLGSQDSVNKIVIETQVEMVAVLKTNEVSNKTIVELRERLIDSENHRLELMSDNTFIYMVSTTDSLRMNLIEIKKYAEKYIEIKDSIKNTDEKFRKRIRKKGSGSRKEF